MYWSLGAPRVYAAAKRRRKHSLDPDGNEDEEEEAKAKEADAVIGLRVSRNGQYFATITATTLLIWQTSVGQGQRQSDRF